MTASPEAPGRPPSGAAWWVLAGLPLIFWAHFRGVEASNFGGYDEWLILSLVSHGVVDFPYANRPLALLWSLPAAAFGPPTPQAFLLLHSAYSVGAALLVWLLWRQLRPGWPAFAFAVAVVTLVWLPEDFMRLNAVQSTMQSGFTAATLGSMVLFLVAWRRRSLVLFGLSVGLAVLAARCYEGVVALLAATPALAWLYEGRWCRRLTRWAAAWLAAMAGLALLILRGLASAEGATWQAGGLGLDLSPLGVAGRLLWQYAFHLRSLFRPEPQDLLAPRSLLALAVYGLVAYAVLRREPPTAGREPEPRALLGLMAAGLAWAGLGYGVYVLSAAITTAARTQFLAAPGIAVFLCAAFTLVARVWPPRARRAAVAVLVGGVVLIGTGRTAAMQRFWSASSRFPVQHHLLRQLVAEVPDVRPNTLVVLVDEAGAFPATFTFQHAVEFLYGPHARGCVWQGYDFLYPSRWTVQGVALEPMASIREPWEVPPTRHRFDELVLVRYPAGGRLAVLDRWPASLPALPAGASYAPRARMVGAPSDAPGRAVLR